MNKALLCLGLLAVGLSWIVGRTDNDGGVLVYPMARSEIHGRTLIEPMTFTGIPATQDVIQRWYGVAVSLRRDGHHTCVVRTVKDWECWRQLPEGRMHSSMLNGQYFSEHPRGKEIVHPLFRFAWNGYRWQEKLSTPTTDTSVLSIPWLALGLLFPVWG
jgi:hypothetical protein